MAYQKKNLLEAFQASAAAEKKAQASAPRDVPPRAGGPFAEPAVAPEPRPKAASREVGPLSRLIALQVVITIAAFFLGRASVSRVDAGEPRTDAAREAALAPGGQPSSSVSAPPRASEEQRTVEVDAQPGTPAERALLDPRNRYTVKVVEYRKGLDDALAAETLAWLSSQGLPAAAKFQGARLYILVGAAPQSSELKELVARARTIDGPPPLSKKAEFSDAYIEQIDKLIDR